MPADAEGPGKGVKYMGYSPWIVTLEDGSKQLIQIFVDPDGSISMVQIAHRNWDWETWGVPLTAEQAP